MTRGEAVNLLMLRIIRSLFIGISAVEAFSRLNIADGHNPQGLILHVYTSDDGSHPCFVSSLDHCFVIILSWSIT